MNKKKTKHQKRLAQIQNKKIQRTIRFQPQPFSLWDFFRTYPAELLAGAIIIGIILLIPRWDSWMNKQEKKAAVSTIPEELKQQLLGRYPNGFKLLEIKNRRMTSLDDTLSSDFRLDWDGAQLMQLDSGKIRIKLPNAYHDSTRGILKNLVVDFQRRHHEFLHINQLTDFELRAEILEDDGNRVVCLFSFEVIGEKSK